MVTDVGIPQGLDQMSHAVDGLSHRQNKLLRGTALPQIDFCDFE